MLAAGAFAEKARRGASAEDLAAEFLEIYSRDHEITYPINPFEMLRECGVVFAFRDFHSYEGIYIPPSDGEDAPAVGIRLRSRIRRQRFTAAHELCHHLKDTGQTFICLLKSKSPVERYADEFASALLMPPREVRAQIAVYAQGPDGKVDMDGALHIAEHFGVSLQACAYRLAYDFDSLDGDVSSLAMKERFGEFAPEKKRREMGFGDRLLYEQILDGAGNLLHVSLEPLAMQLFETTYIFHDSRMEGVNIDQETAAQIVVDLRTKGSSSPYCTEDNSNIVEVAGLSRAYRFVFEKASDPEFDVSIYDSKEINRLLYSTAPFSTGGSFRSSSAMVTGASFEPASARDIPMLMMELGRKVDAAMEKAACNPSGFVEDVVEIHHRLTRIHPFADGNGRSSRAFASLMLLKGGYPPVLFPESRKDSYKTALALADESGDLSDLFVVYSRQIIESHAMLSVPSICSPASF